MSGCTTRSGAGPGVLRLAGADARLAAARFIAAVPAELEESAQIDGCTPLGAFLRVTVPLLWPGLVAGAILVS
jgi:ABC-type glycerol-3-phosphate transport system permease component